jgi:hypothetical protein
MASRATPASRNERGETKPAILDALVAEYPEFAQKTYEDFFQFTWRVFARSFEEWVPGTWIKRRCEFLQSARKTCDIGPRNHFKSTGLYAYFAWKLWRAGFDALGVEWAGSSESFEAHYFSYKQKSAGYHIGQGSDSIRSLIERNPLFADLEDLKPRAETKGKWTWNGADEITIAPHGMLSHTRGIHARLVFVDDPFQDPENNLDPTSILKINDVFRATVSSIPKTDADDELHVTTTPQTCEDFVFDEELLSEYAHMVQPAIDDTGDVLWPEWMNRDALAAKKREIGPKLFNQEYQCSPKSAEVAFFAPEEIGEMCVPHLTDWGKERSLTTGDPPAKLTRWLGNDAVTGVVGGLDIGKKRHPSHLSVFAVVRRRSDPASRRAERGEARGANGVSDPAGHLVQLHQKWMDSWDYTRQIDYCRRAIGMFDVDVLAYDATRGEFDGLDERGELPSAMDGVTLSSPVKNAMAGVLDAAASRDGLVLLPDDRQRRQFGVVTNDLDAVETAEGHGEPFTSIGLAVRAAREQSWGRRVYSVKM